MGLWLYKEKWLKWLRWLRGNAFGEGKVCRIRIIKRHEFYI